MACVAAQRPSHSFVFGPALPEAAGLAFGALVRAASRTFACTSVQRLDLSQYISKRNCFLGSPQPIDSEPHRFVESIDPHHIFHGKTSLTGENTQSSVALFTD
jgi:hypothetical protein